MEIKRHEINQKVVFIGAQLINLRIICIYLKQCSLITIVSFSTTCSNRIYFCKYESEEGFNNLSVDSRHFYGDYVDI